MGLLVLGIDEGAHGFPKLRHQGQQVFVRFLGRLCQDFDDPDKAQSAFDRKGEGAVNPGRARDLSAGEIRSVANIGNPGRLAGCPNPSRQADAGFKRGGPVLRVECVRVQRRLMPGGLCAQSIRGVIDQPERAQFPAGVLADGLEQARQDGRRVFQSDEGKHRRQVAHPLVIVRMPLREEALLA